MPKRAYTCQGCGKKLYELGDNRCPTCFGIICSACVRRFDHLPDGDHILKMPADYVPARRAK